MDIRATDWSDIQTTVHNGSLIYTCTYHFFAGGLALFLVSDECKCQCRISNLQTWLAKIF